MPAFVEKEIYYFSGLGKKYELPPINIPPNIASEVPIITQCVVKKVDKYTPNININKPTNDKIVTFFISASKRYFISAN
jgi:hypothetical protein